MPPRSSSLWPFHWVLGMAMSLLWCVFTAPAQPGSPSAGDQASTTARPMGAKDQPRGLQTSQPALARGPVGFLAPEISLERLGPEARGAYWLAKEIAGAELILPTASGELVDEPGKPISLDRFQVLWLHQGDATGSVFQARSLENLKQFVVRGNGLFLSGSALQLVHALGAEPAQPRQVSGSTARGSVSLHTLEGNHPIFRGLLSGFPWDESVGGFVREFDVAFAEASLANYADFVGSGGPRGGRSLGWVDEDQANPLVEYELGRGRILVLGGRLPSYAHQPPPPGGPLGGLTGNILAYLGHPEQWQTVQARPATTEPPIPQNEWGAFERAIRDLATTFGGRYPKAHQYLERLQTLHEAAANPISDNGQPNNAKAAHYAQVAEQFRALRSEALLANPLLDFEQLLLVQRGLPQMGLPANFNANTELPRSGYDNQLVVLSPVRPEGTLTTLYRPANGEFVGDVDLHFDGGRLLFSMPGANGRWQIFELNTDGSNLHELPLIQQPDVDNYNACYLPDERVMFTSTAPFVGVPCVAGSSFVANLYLLGRDRSIRQLTVDQEHNWCPTVANSGRVMYLRWEYTDLPHSNSRILFEMNPDGTDQRAIFKSSSFFPPSFFYARPIPGHPSMVVGIATGHHGVSRSGRLLIVDPAQGSREAEGVVQEIPGWGKKVQPIIRDTLADGVWPQFLHPYPLSAQYFLVSAKLSPNVPWGLYLVDVFDNMVLVKELPGYALLEPRPLRKTTRPPAIPDKVDEQAKEAVVYLSNVYEGPGLAGIPRGTVKKLRLITYNYAYRGMGGLLGTVGMDGPWDIKRVLGTVPVEADGSARFLVPANTPIAVQPLDEAGQALQLMRSWFTAMPGETLSCAGCHEPAHYSPANRQNIAATRPPSVIQPWYGPVRGFAFAREVQPVLDRYCIRCHDGQTQADSSTLADLRGEQRLTNWSSNFAGNMGPKYGGQFSVSYAALHRFVRRPGIESDIHLLTPMEFHAGTTELVQMLRKGHHQVQLDCESWDRLITWIDLNAPFHGTWTEIMGEALVKPMNARRRAMSRLYANVDEDPEVIQTKARLTAPASSPAAPPSASSAVVPVPGWPGNAAEAQRRQTHAGRATKRTIQLGRQSSLDFALIPAGEFVMGDARGNPDERPLTRVKIEKPFWMSQTEISNEQFAQFDPDHDSHFEPMHAYQFGIHGFPVNQPGQPVVRVSWHQAVAFCQWLSARTGRPCSLPTEAQWEYACRAGTASPFWYGDLNTDFSSFANLGDSRLKGYLLETYIHVRPILNPSPYDDWVPKDDRFDDGAFVSADVGHYRPNPWGLYDMHGNAWEWTRTAYRPYPYTEADSRSAMGDRNPKVVRGGSWYDRPQRCRSGYRLAYPPYERAFNLGFRVIFEAE
jgi:formylglycine-generating enzyme required for sulfatase activity